MRSGWTHPDEGPIVAVGVTGVAAALAGLAFFVNVSTYNVAVGVVVAVCIVAVSVPLLQRLAAVDGSPKLVWVLLAALIAKLAFSVARYWMVNRLYGGGGDSNRYDADGWDFAQAAQRRRTLFPQLRM